MNYIGPFAMIISAGVKLNASDVFNILDPDSGGGNTFSVALSANGALPVTDYACRTYLESETYAALTEMTVQEFKAYVDSLQVQRGRTAVGSITAFKNNIRISEQDQDFWGYITSLGLKTIEEPV